MTFKDEPGASPPEGGEERAESYDRFVDWGKRLEREAPFFRDLFGSVAARRIADVGCGTGKHAVMFATWGLDVLGVDPAADMLAQARANVDTASLEIAAAGGSVMLLEGGFGQVAPLLGCQVDALVCTGNALPHVGGIAGLRAALADFGAAVRPGGTIVLHLLNHDRLISKKVRSMTPVVRDDDEGTWVFLRVLDYVEDGIRFDFVTMNRPVGGWVDGVAWETVARRSLHTAIPSSVLVAGLETAGFEDVRLFGDHALTAFDRDVHESVIVTAIRS